jgi:subtilisin family serine protease
VAVTVLDTGIDCAHLELQANIVQYPGFSAFAGANPCTDDNSHGTAVMLALQQKSNLSFAQVLSLLQSTASPLPGFSPQQGAGLINFEEMLQALQ